MNEATTPIEPTTTPEGVTQFPPQPRLRVVRELEEAETNVSSISDRVAKAIDENKPKPKPRKKAAPKPKAAKVDPLRAVDDAAPPVTRESPAEPVKPLPREEAFEALFDPHDLRGQVPPKRSSWFRRFVSSFSAGGRDDSDRELLLRRSMVVREPIVPIYIGLALTVFVVAAVYTWLYVV